jgi:hypothetical protein
MMMGMLQAGGMELLVDGIRTADDDNPKGYYEFERIKKLKEDKGWLTDARGKVVKGISQLLFDLPTEAGYRYNVIFMRRNIEEVLASQKKMLIRRGTYKQEVSDEEVRRMFLVHLDHVVDWLNKRACFKTLYINYNMMIKDPADKVEAINQFLGGELDTAAMTAVIDKSLYRNRGEG